jgi:hypothetical protein
MVRTIREVGMRKGNVGLGLAAAWSIALVFILGCGNDDGLGRRYPVRGRVMYRSQPLKTGRITFHPIDTVGTARAATGTIQDGYYTLSTLGGDDDARPGSYRVAIVAKSADRSKIRPIGEGGPERQTDVVIATRKAKDLIPAKYISPRSTPLTREVKAETNRFDFELED